MVKALRKCKITDYEGDGQYWVEENDGPANLVDNSELVDIKVGYRVKMLCFDPQPTSPNPYEDTPAVNPIFFAKSDAFQHACQLADAEAEDLNENAAEGVSFGIPIDEDYEKENRVRVCYYYNPTGDETGNTEQVTNYFVEEVRFALLEDEGSDQEEEVQ